MTTLKQYRQYCSVEGCENPRRKREWCQAHYMRFYHFGDPLAIAPTYDINVITQRFWSNVVITPICWEWTGDTNGHGYGRFGTAGKQVGAHRWAYESLIGKIPDGMHIDHLCRNRLCVNIEHLEVVTPQENQSRGIKGSKWRTCQRGHEFTAETTGRDHGRRFCRICRSNTRRARIAKVAA